MARWVVRVTRRLLEIDLGIAKTEKHASRDSGDTVELVERPSGGFSVVMIDGQGSGLAAKTLSLLLSSKAVTLLKEGVRDGVVARATHDFLFAFRHGQVSATFDVLSIDLKTRTVVVTRNADAPMLVGERGCYRAEPCGSGPIGRYRWTKPTVTELPIVDGLQIIMFTDGIFHSGRRQNLGVLDLAGWVTDRFDTATTAQALADALLDEAVARDQGRPNDDMAVVALSLRTRAVGMVVRRMQAQVPLP